MKATVVACRGVRPPWIIGMRDSRRIFIVTSIFVLLSRAVYPIAQGRICTKAESMAAEESVDRLSSWIEIYNSFKGFGH
jgi:hypothetical protein